MAVAQKETVVSSTADGDVIPGPVNVVGIKVVGGASGMTVSLKSDGVTGGTVLYQSTVGNSTSLFEAVEFRASKGLYVNISAGGGTVYIYRKPC